MRRPPPPSIKLIEVFSCRVAALDFFLWPTMVARGRMK
jgi:hypothetical protein